MFKKAILIFSLFLILSTGANSAYAQDVGTPVFKKLTFYTLGGGLAGSFVSILIWATDPLNPDVAFKDQLMVGFGAGVVIGFFVGANQLINDQVPTVYDYPYQNYSLEYSRPQLPDAFISANEGYVRKEFGDIAGSKPQISGTLFQARF